MQLLSPSQCRAARALLGWSQPDLGARSGVHVQTISAFEGEASTPTKTTLSKLTDALEKGGVEFLPNDGTARQTNPIIILEGEDAYYELINDVFYTLKGTKGEVWLSGVKEPDHKDERRKEYILMHIERLKKHGIRERLLVRHGDTNFLAPKEWYRWMPKNFDTSTLFYLYGDKAAFVDLEDKNFKIMIFENKLYTRVLKDMYEYTWQHAVIPE
jgi:transcriptional regulator with XRE-family HTH domain